MNLHGLRLFYEVAKQKSVTQAAKKLAISQPSVTAQIKKFEQEENVSLLSPDGRGIKLTSIGQELYEEAEKLFEIEKKIEKRIDDFINQERSIIKFSGNYVTLNYLLPQWLAEFKLQQVSAIVQMEMLNTGEAIDKLLSQQVDFAFVGALGEKYADVVNLKKIGIDELGFIAARGHKYANKKIPLSQLVKEPFIGRESGSYTKAQLANLCTEAGVSEPKTSFQCNGVHEAVSATVLGNGIHFCSMLVVEKQIASGELARVYTEEPISATPLYMCTRKKDKLTGTEHLFLEFLNTKTPL